MIVRAGFQSFELQRSFELPRPLLFGSRDEALKVLKQLGFLNPETILRVREYLAHFSDDPECFRLTDDEAVERLAELLYSRKVVLVAREQRGSGGAPSKTPTTLVAFPLSERTPRRSTASPAPVAPAEDQPTFDPRLDAVAQAAALVAAANEVEPFCLE